MKLKPLFDRVLLKTLPEKPQTVGKIVLPEISKAPEISEVVALGLGKLDDKEIQFEVKVGDKVVFNKFSGFEFKIDGETYTIIKEKDILGIIE